MTKISQKFYEKIETRKRCKGVHCVDLGESIPTHILLQISASIQRRTRLVKFARSPRTDPSGRAESTDDRMALCISHFSYSTSVRERAIVDRFILSRREWAIQNCQLIVLRTHFGRGKKVVGPCRNLQDHAS